jgi:AcrR family transcriptional regulator
MPLRYTMETTAIFRATLRLIREGKFCFLSMAEIGYHARVSASTVETLFESREALVRALGENIFHQLAQLIKGSAAIKGSAEDRYYYLWARLSEHYQHHPDVIPFLNHFSFFPFDVTGIKEMEQQFMDLLREETKEISLHRGIDAGTFTHLIHENIKIAATLGSEENTRLATMLLSGLRYTAHNINSMEAA